MVNLVAVKESKKCSDCGYNFNIELLDGFLTGCGA